MPIRGVVQRNARAPAADERIHSLGRTSLTSVRRRLLQWGRRNFRHYPWRFETDPWLSLVAEILLQRTRASQVEAVFAEFKTRFPTARALASSDPDAVRDLTGRLGLHFRGPQLFAIAHELVVRGGAPPDSMDELCRFSGIGMYTAAAWLSLHRGKRAVILDANVCRWLGRLTGHPCGRDPRHVRWVQELADDLTPTRVFRDYNYAVLDFTMDVCRPRKPLCEECPLSTTCRSAAARRSAVPPPS